jgi:aminoglycoside phosphotransferase (APT) family kinase protein
MSDRHPRGCREYGVHIETIGAIILMKSPDSVEKTTLLARASTADVYAWSDGRVLKLFHERTPWHANEVTATRVAHEARLPVPEVIGGLIEVGEREGIVFEWIDGPTMTEYIEDHPDKVEDCAQQAAELQARIHAIEVTELPPLIDLLSWSIQQAEPLEEKTRKTVLDVLNGLPAGGVLCHNDFYPNNILVSPQGLVVIDWAIGTRGNPLADLARTWLISKMWLGGLEEKKAPEPLQRMWQRFWEMYFQRYGELRSYNLEDLIQWRIVAAAASLVWGPPVASIDQRVSFIQAALGGTQHPWLSG